MSKREVIIVGGGAAGLLCAGFLGKQGATVTVVDKNARPARKVLITGKGRCNVTNNCTPDEMIRQVRTNGRFLYSAFNSFSPMDAMELFEGLGVPLKTERGRRVFPISDQAADIAEAMIRFAKESGARFLQKERVSEVLVQEGTVSGVQLESGKILSAQQVVIATGGCSYPLTGSNGDGYRLAAQLGHEIIPQRPSLVPLVTKERWCGELMGLSLKNVVLTLVDKREKQIYREQGEMLFTHFGLSGPLVLSASAYMKDDPKTYSITINLKPALSREQLDARLLRDFGEYSNRDMGNALDKLLPQKLIPVMLDLAEIPVQTKVHSLTKEQRGRLLGFLQALPLHPKAFGSLEEAVITAGGISVKQVDPRTMESKLVRGLFFAGEVLDVDAFTGGYNLQIAYSTAYVAAKGMS